MRQWEYRKINLNDTGRKTDDIDLLDNAGKSGWELVGIATNNVAYLKDEVVDRAEEQPAIPAQAQESIFVRRHGHEMTEHSVAREPTLTVRRPESRCGQACGLVRRCLDARPEQQHHRPACRKLPTRFRGQANVPRRPSGFRRRAHFISQTEATNGGREMRASHAREPRASPHQQTPERVRGPNSAAYNYDVSPVTTLCHLPYNSLTLRIRSSSVASGYRAALHDYSPSVRAASATSGPSLFHGISLKI